MQKLLLVLLFIPLTSFSQYVVDKKVGDVDITKITDEYITVSVGNFYFPEHTVKTSNFSFKINGSKKKKKWNTIDNKSRIRVRTKVELLNFMNKYGWEYIDTDSRSSSFTNIATGQVQSSQSVTLTFKNNNN